jgi:hypothetical protein
MKNSPFTTVLLWILAGSAVLSLVLCGFYVSYARKLKGLQYSQNNIMLVRQVAPALARDAVEYSQKHPDLEPVLEQTGVKTLKGAPATTNKAAAKK